MDTEVQEVMPVAPERRRSRAAVVALGLMAGAFVVGASVGSSEAFRSYRVGGGPSWIPVVAFVILGVYVASIVLGIVALVRIRRAHGGLSGRTPAWVAVIVSTLVVVSGVVSAIASPSGSLAKDDFEEGHFWSEDDDPLVRQRFVEGGYEVVIKSAGEPSLSRYFSEDPATPNLTFTSEATFVDTAGGDVYAGVTCWGAPTAGYLGALGSDGMAAILKVFNDRSPETLTERAGVPYLGQAVTTQLSIECRGGGTEPTQVVLRANGNEIVRADDQDGLDGFSGVGLWYGAEHAGAVIRWNDSSASTG